MKYKVGQKVRIKNIDWYNLHKRPLTEAVDFNNGPNFIKEMSCFCNKVMTIVAIEENVVYLMEEDDSKFDWSDDMIEELVEEETKPKFKVGDKVITNKGYIGKFEGWVSDYQVRVLFEESGCNVVIHPKNLKLMEEENKSTLSKNEKLDSERFAEDVNVSEFKSQQEEIMKLLLQGALNIPEGYSLKDQDGNIINVKYVTLEKKKKMYPTTYTECCRVLGYSGNYNITVTTDVDNKLFNALYKLKVCRDAYWKLYGEEMGLGKRWEPDYIEESWEQGSPIKYVIYYDGTHITKGRKCTPSYILSFPTEEMRDFFLEKFGELIEQCKELL